MMAFIWLTAIFAAWTGFVFLVLAWSYEKAQKDSYNRWTFSQMYKSQIGAVPSMPTTESADPPDPVSGQYL